MRRVLPHQIGQVGLISAHELPLLADGHHPVVDGLVEVLPDVILKVVTVDKIKTLFLLDLSQYFILTLLR